MHGVHARTTCAATANVSLVSCEADAAGGPRPGPPELRGHRRYFDQDAGCPDPGNLCATSRGGRSDRLQMRPPGMQAIRVSRSDPGFEMYAALPLACRVASDEIWLRR